MSSRQYTLLDRIIIEADAVLRTVVTKLPSQRANPAGDLPEPDLTPQQKRESAGMMRVNHTGEVCAQALYRGQMSVAKSKKTYDMLAKACAEEIDHLAWTHERLNELNSHRSYLNGIWYIDSFVMGVVAGLAGDRWSLGFIEETEAQVTRHLDKHLGAIAKADYKSRKIIEQMREDEIQHGESAAKAGANELPWMIKKLMTAHAKVMTTVAYWV